MDDEFPSGTYKIFAEVELFFNRFIESLTAKAERKMVVLMRGLPGSGKSTFVVQLFERAKYYGIESVVCSADDYFYDEYHQYHYDPRDVSSNHAKCFAKFERHLRAAPGQLDFVKLIIVDNTNIRKDEMDKYLNAVREFHDVRYHSFRFKCRNDEEAATQCLRTVHCVPLRFVLRRFDEYRHYMDPDEETEVNPRYDDLDAFRLYQRVPHFKY
jgi:AAA domain